MHKIIIPRFDPAMKTGRIVKWLKNEGETVKKGEPLLTVEGEKTVFDVEAPVDGVLRRVLYPPGSEVEVLKPVALIGGPEEPLPPEFERPVEAAPKLKVPAPTKPLRIKASPLARKLAEEHGISLEGIKGTGPGGRITKEDVLAALKERGAPPPAAPTVEAAIPTLKLPPVVKTVKLAGVRKAVAERLSYSFRTAVPTTITTSVNLEKLLEHREKMKASVGDVSLTAFITRAVAKALEAYPIFNSTIEGEEIKIFGEINVAIAINTGDGLVTPVVKEANKKSVLELSQAIRELTEKALQRKLSLEEMVGGTFTITNLGPYDVEIFIPIINPPQVAILGVGKIARKPIVTDGEMAIKPVAVLAFVFDHRVADGAPATKFLREIKRLLEDPSSLT